MITTMLRWKTSTAREKTTTQMIIWPFLCGDLFSRACTWLFPHRFEWTQTQKCIHVFESTKYDAPISPWYPIRIGFSCRSSDSFVEFGNRPTPSGIQKPSIQVITLLAPIERFMVLIEKMIRIMCECVIPLHGYKYSVSRSEHLQIKTPNMVFSCSSLYGLIGLWCRSTTIFFLHISALSSLRYRFFRIQLPTHFFCFCLFANSGNTSKQISIIVIDMNAYWKLRINEKCARYFWKSS